MSPRHASLFLALALLTGCATASPRAAPSLQQRLEAMAAGHRGKVSLYARHLGTGETVAIDADRPVKTASTIKVPVMLEAFHQVKAGRLALDEKLTLTADDKVLGSGVLGFLHTGLELTLEDAVVLMIVLSDNTATNLLIERLGIEAVNARMRALGLPLTTLYKKVYKPAPASAPPEQKQFGLGRSTAREMAAVLEAIERCELGAPVLCRRMRDILRAQQYRHMLPRYVETVDATDVPSAVASKVGELDGTRIDVGILYGRSGPIVISAFTYDNQDQRWTPDTEAYTLIGRMAQAIVEAWSPAGLRTGEQDLSSAQQP